MSLRNFPDFITHYSRGEPFRSITSLPRNKWTEIINELNETNAWGLNRFLDPQYLSQRLEVERFLRQEFIFKGGRPELSHPIYFFLGRHSGFEKHERNKGYILNLKDISSDSITFTYGDSLLALNKDNRQQSGEKYKSELCKNIFRIEDLNSLFSDPRFPKTEPLHIEAQLWITPAQIKVKNLEL